MTKPRPYRGFDGKALWPQRRRRQPWAPRTHKARFREGPHFRPATDCKLCAGCHPMTCAPPCYEVARA